MTSIAQAAQVRSGIWCALTPSDLCRWAEQRWHARMLALDVSLTRHVEQTAGRISGRLGVPSGAAARTALHACHMKPIDRQWRSRGRQPPASSTSRWRRWTCGSRADGAAPAHRSWSAVQRQRPRQTPCRQPRCQADVPLAAAATLTRPGVQRPAVAQPIRLRDPSAATSQKRQHDAMYRDRPNTAQTKRNRSSATKPWYVAAVIQPAAKLSY